MNPQTIIIIVILIIILVPAVMSSIKHMKGEGECCGGGSKEKKIKSKELGNVIGTRIISIEGMRCSNCSTRVHNTLNSMDGISAKVSLEKKQAIVQMEKEITDEELEKTITRLGYKVISIK